MNKTIGLLGCVVLLLTASAMAQDKWAVHEWGTFTSLQDESGNAIGGINTDDEPVPPFVHQLTYSALLRTTELPAWLSKGAPNCHPDVTMRLETPVIYFHPPASQTAQTVDVSVKFHGGWLTEFYPDARTAASELDTNGWFKFGPIHSDTESELAWNGLKIGGNWEMTDTTAHVWTSPRAVSAASVQTTNGEAEKFLFYRGIGHIDAPLKVSREDGQLVFRSQLENVPVDRPLGIHSMWLVDIKRDRSIAFRSLPPLTLDSDPGKILTTTAASFGAGDFSADNLEKLKASLKASLMAEGLFDDEAQALLNTWEVSYFKSAGIRVFFIVPRAWTDYYLPLQVSVPADINRVMVGRIELVTPEQRNIMKYLASVSVQKIRQDQGQLLTNYYTKYFPFLLNTNKPIGDMQQLNKNMAQLDSGQKHLADFISVPSTYRAYLALGRFRNALVLDEANSRPTEGLTSFIAGYRLQGYRFADTQ